MTRAVSAGCARALAFFELRDESTFFCAPLCRMTRRFGGLAACGGERRRAAAGSGGDESRCFGLANTRANLHVFGGRSFVVVVCCATAAMAAARARPLTNSALDNKAIRARRLRNEPRKNKKNLLLATKKGSRRNFLCSQPALFCAAAPPL